MTPEQAHARDEHQRERLRARLPVVTPRPGRTRRNLPPEEWRFRIMQVARTLFNERGYDETRMEEIAEVAGISRPRLYAFFPGRRELFEAIITQDAQGLAGELLLELARATDLDGKVRALVDVFFRFVEVRQDRNRLLYSEAAQSDPALGELMRTVRSALAETFSNQLAEMAGADRGHAERRLMSHAVIALAEGAATAWMSGPHLDRDRATRIVTEVALRAFGGPTTQAM